VTDGDIGHVEDVYFDDHAWVIRFLVINTSNWWLGHKVLIAPQWIGSAHWSDETVTVDLTCEAVKGAPIYDPSAEFDWQSEKDLFGYCARLQSVKAGSRLEPRI